MIASPPLLFEIYVLTDQADIDNTPISVKLRMPADN
jgi:hypothetical protein